MEILIILGVGFMILSLFSKTTILTKERKDPPSELHPDDEIWDELYDDTDDADEGDGDDN